MSGLLKSSIPHHSIIQHNKLDHYNYHPSFSAELAAQLYADELQQQRSSPSPDHPPSSLEEYQRAAARDEHMAQKRFCTLM